jgi:hypothetical protein
MREKINRLIRRVIATEPCPKICWDEVIRVDALGTDAIGPFEVSLTFTHSDGTQAIVCVHHKGYDEIADSLPGRFPSISPSWYQEMSEQPWHVERVLFQEMEWPARAITDDQRIVLNNGGWP